MSTIEDRLRHLISVVTENRQRDKKLFEKTGIGTDTWKNFWFNRRAVDAKMVEAVSKAWPEYAFWLVTGIDDELHGHNFPASPSWLPEDGHPAPKEFEAHMVRSVAGRLFRAKLDHKDYVDRKLIENPHFDTDDQLARLESLLTQLAHLREEEERRLSEPES